MIRDRIDSFLMMEGKLQRSLALRFCVACDNLFLSGGKRREGARTGNGKRKTKEVTTIHTTGYNKII